MKGRNEKETKKLKIKEMKLRKEREEQRKNN